MTQEEKFSLHLPYKVKMFHEDMYLAFGLTIYEEMDSDTVDLYCVLESSKYKPMLRSFNHLTKECVQADYNDGKPFVPINEFEIGDGDNNGLEYDNGNIKLIRSLDSISENGFVNDIKYFPLGVIQQLLKWHFAIGFEAGEYIEVTNENNPYI